MITFWRQWLALTVVGFVPMLGLVMLLGRLGAPWWARSVAASAIWLLAARCLGVRP